MGHVLGYVGYEGTNQFSVLGAPQATNLKQLSLAREKRE